MEELKEQYNTTLKRYYLGCFYIEQHPNEIDKYLPAVLDLLNKLNNLIYHIGDMSEQEILGGF